MDDFDHQQDGNADEALYVFDLTLNAGASIDPAGRNLYYLNGGDPKQFFHGDADLDRDVDIFDWNSISTGARPAAERPPPSAQSSLREPLRLSWIQQRNSEPSTSPLL